MAKFLAKHPDAYRRWYANNKDHMHEKYQKQKDHINKLKRKNRAIWKQNPENAVKIREYNRQYTARRYKNDINFKIKLSIRNRMAKFINRGNRRGSPIKYLGCNLEFFKHYIAAQFLQGMTWDNYGQWEIDHIIPLSIVDLTNPDEYKAACHYTNLRPMWAIENNRKNNSIPENFNKSEWLASICKLIEQNTLNI